MSKQTAALSSTHHPLGTHGLWGSAVSPPHRYPSASADPANDLAAGVDVDVIVDAVRAASDSSLLPPGMMLGHSAKVLLQGDWLKMSGADAHLGEAAVVDGEAVGDRPDLSFPGEAVREHLVAVLDGEPVSLAVFGAWPQPAVGAAAVHEGEPFGGGVPNLRGSLVSVFANAVVAGT